MLLSHSQRALGIMTEEAGRITEDRIDMRRGASVTALAAALRGADGPSRLSVRDRALTDVRQYTLSGSMLPTPVATPRLSPQEIWAVYHLVPDVRACVDMIQRRVAAWEYDLRPVLDPKDSKYDHAQMVARKLKKRLGNPNTDNELWFGLVTKWVHDLLLFDKAVFEKVYAKDRGRARMVELVAGKSVIVFPVLDETGHVRGYTKVRDLNEAWLYGFVPFNPKVHGQPGALIPKKAVTMSSLFPETSTHAPSPLIDTIVNEFSTLRQSSEHINRAFSPYDVPPGVLFASGVDLNNKTAREEMQGLQNYNTKDQRLRILAAPEPNATAQWIEFSHTPKDIGYESIVSDVRRIVYRTFGVLNADMGDTAALAGDSRSQQPTSTQLMVPVLKLLQATLNLLVLPDMLEAMGEDPDDPIVEFKFNLEEVLTAAEQRDKATSQATRVIHGIITINEARKESNYGPIEYGDVPRANGVPLPDVNAAASAAADPAAKPEGMAVEQDTAQNSDSTQDSPGRPPDRAAIAGFRQVRLEMRAAEEDPWADLPPDEQRLDLAALSLLLLGYSAAVDSAWQRAALALSRELPSIPASHRGVRVREAVAGFMREWSLVVPGYYDRAAALGARSGRALGGNSLDTQALSRAYYEEMMGYLPDLAGDISDSALRELDAAEARGDDPLLLGGAVGEGFLREAYRTPNWSGKLLDLATLAMTASLLASGEDWQYLWVRTAGSRSCPVCVEEGGAGWRALSAMVVRPGADTRCGGRCRCYLVHRLKGEA